MILPNPTASGEPIAPEVSVVAAAHNEADSLPRLVGEIVEALTATGRSFEIVIVDDASSDDSERILAELQIAHPTLRHRRMARQSGQSAALAAAFDLARGGLVVTLDADLQNDPADIPRLLEGIGPADCVIGYRTRRHDSITKLIISRFANRIRNWATRETVRDTGCGLKAFRAECLGPIARFDGMHRFFPTLVKMHGFTVAEIPVNHRPRSHGRTHYGLRNRSIRPILDLLAVCWLQRRTIRYRLVEEGALVR